MWLLVNYFCSVVIGYGKGSLKLELTSVGWDLIPSLGSQPAGDTVIKPAVGCHYFPPGLQSPSQL